MIYGFQDFKIFPSDYELKDNVLPVITTSGVIYEVLVPTNFLEEKPEYMTVMYTYHHQTERGQALYGFNCKEDKVMFTDLITVDGFGPSGALKLMSAFTPAKIRIDIADGDADALSKAKGLGKKTSDKIILKLQDDYKEFKTLDSDKSSKILMLNKDLEIVQEIEDTSTKALIKLGYPSRESRNRVRKAMSATLPLKTSDTTIKSIDELVSGIVTHALTVTIG